MEKLDKELIAAYGTQVEKDLEIINNKISAVVAAHMYAGKVGDNPLCKLNRILIDIIK